MRKIVPASSKHDLILCPMEENRDDFPKMKICGMIGLYEEASIHAYKRPPEVRC